MSSPQVIDSEKLIRQANEALNVASRNKHKIAADEAIAKQQAAVAGMDGIYSTSDASAQLGRPLSRQIIIGRLSMMNPNLVFEQANADPAIGAVYLRDGVSNMDDPDPKCRGRRHIVGMEWTGLSPEFTTRKIETDIWGKPQMKGQIRGWRTVLARLIHERLIGVAETERVFSISRGRESQRWFEEIS